MRYLYILPLVGVLALVPLAGAAEKEASTTSPESKGSSYGTTSPQGGTAGHPGEASMSGGTNFVSLEQHKPLHRATDLLDMSIRHVGAGGAQARASGMAGGEMGAKAEVEGKARMGEKSSGEHSGKVEDLILSSDNKRAEFIVASFDAPTVENKWCKIPFREVKITSDGSALIYSSNKGLEQLSCFSSDAFPQETEFRRVTRLIKFDIRDNAGESAGSIRDLLIASSDGRIREATVSVGGVAGVGAKLASVDWSKVTFTEKQEFAKVNISSDELNRLAYDRKEYWERLGFAGEKGEERGMREPELETERYHKGSEKGTYERGTPPGGGSEPGHSGTGTQGYGTGTEGQYRTQPGQNEPEKGTGTRNY
jgi:sporulation protein YlmC with PRC-barrel domain